MAGPGKPGRPSKGPRQKISVVLPDTLLEVLEADAQARGLDRNSWVVEVLYGSYPNLPKPLPQQETLPLTEAA